MIKRVGLRLDPLDTLFFRDGRPFDAATRGEGGLPFPRTLAGALRTRLVSQHADLTGLSRLRREGLPIRDALRKLHCPDWVLSCQFRGPWLARTDSEIAPLVPCPVTLARSGDRVVRAHPLDPHRLPGWRDSRGLWPLWRTGDPDAKPLGGYLKPAALRAFLAGDEVKPADVVPPGELYGFDDRTGLAICPDRLTGEEGKLYGIRLLALARHVGFYAEALLPQDAPRDAAAQLGGLLPLGGEGRYVNVTSLAAPYTWPEVKADGQSLWLLLSPAPLKQAHCPDVLPAGVQVMAAATASPVVFSGWDVARVGPEPTRFAVPAGAVYYLKGPFAPPGESFCTEPEDVAVGWGFALRGVWKNG